MFLPIQTKPTAISNFKSLVIEIPDLITKEMAEELCGFALNKELSGMHRRGSKSVDCVASFNTCLVFHHSHHIYDILDSAWEQFCSINRPLIDFIEPYEIKSYIKGDMFGPHSDILINTDIGIERKMNLIVQLTESNEYDGGDLMVGSHRCSRKQGTGIFFPSHYIHSVTEITRGNRLSLIGHAWGPKFK